MSQALYRKWRPARFDQVVGQEHVTQTLRNAVGAERVGHAYLFCGPRGTGKTTTARLLAKAVNCLDEDPKERPCDRCRICKAINDARFLDLIEIDAASNTGVDDMRSLRDKINFSPSDGAFKVYIIDEVHMLSTAAFNALLKTLEEPPAHAIFVLATTEEHKVPLTIKSRCQQFNFRLLTTQEITGRLEWLAEKESLTINDKALALVARHGAGSIRDAESLLDQLVTAPGDTITVERAQLVLGTAAAAVVNDLAGAILRGDGAAGLRTIHEALATGTDARQFCRQMVAHLRQLLLLRTAGTELVLDVPDDEKRVMLALAQNADHQMLVNALKHFNDAAVAPATSWQPQLPLELAFIESLPLAPAPAVLAREARTPAAAAAPEKIEAPALPAVPKAVPAAETPPVALAVVEAASAPAATAPTAETASAAVAAGPTNAGVLDLAQVQANWEAFMRHLGQQDRNLPPLLTMSRPLAAEQNTLVLGFDFPILRDKFGDQPENVELTAQVLSELLGHKCQIRAVVATDYVPAPAEPAIRKEDFAALAEELGGVVNDS